MSLASGATYMELLLPGGLPLGNAVAALGLCAVAGAAMALSARETAVRAVAAAALAGAALWLPVSVLLAGNAQLNFSGERGLAWLALSAVVAAAVTGSLLWAVAASALAALRHRGSR